MPNGSGCEALAYLSQKAISYFPFPARNLDFDQLMAFEGEIQFMHDIFGKSRIADHHYWPQGMGGCGERYHGEQ